MKANWQYMPCISSVVVVLMLLKKYFSTELGEEVVISFYTLELLQISLIASVVMVLTDHVSHYRSLLVLENYIRPHVFLWKAV